MGIVNTAAETMGTFLLVPAYLAVSVVVFVVETGLALYIFGSGEWSLPRRIVMSAIFLALAPIALICGPGMALASIHFGQEISDGAGLLYDKFGSAG